MGEQGRGQGLLGAGPPQDVGKGLDRLRVARGPGGDSCLGKSPGTQVTTLPPPTRGQDNPRPHSRPPGPSLPSCPRPLLPVISSQHCCYRDLSSKDLPGPSASVGDHVLFPRQAPSCLVPCTQCLQWNSLPTFPPEAATSGFLGFRGQGHVCATPLCPQHPFVTAQSTLT